MEHFAVFDPAGTNTVFVLEVFTMLLLFCSCECASVDGGAGLVCDMNAGTEQRVPRRRLRLRSVCSTSVSEAI